jgi:predicted metal-dependent phosphoesterase TrpH
MNAAKVISQTKTGFADLHLHTSLSDGTLSVEELIILSKRKGLRCISITDHDNLESYKLAIGPAEEAGIELIPGIEVSAVWQGKDIHILGYFCDPTNLAMNMELEESAKQRVTRIRAIVKKLNTLGVDITFEKVLSYCKGPVIGALMWPCLSWMKNMFLPFPSFYQILRRRMHRFWRKKD